jgi:hypothetical protein
MIKNIPSVILPFKRSAWKPIVKKIDGSITDSGGGFDRGHMTPNFAIASQYGSLAQLETFLITNISPQKNAAQSRLLAKARKIRGRCRAEI